MPPTLESCRLTTYGPAELQELRSWVAAPGWPRGTLQASALDGYLTALLVWPGPPAVGAWLPWIWRDTGWRVPPVIARAHSLQRFVGLVGGGRLHEIDMRLDSAAELFSAVDRTSLDGGAALFVEWSTGFHLGIALASQLPFHNVTPVARVAAGVIAKAPTRLRQSVPSDFVAELHAAVTMLALDRTNRGPLGSLLKESITASARRLSRRCAD